MKKFTFLMCAVLACLLQVNAQQFVSTDPQSRGVLLEEFTGRTCGYCPDGHVVANSIAASHPGKFWSVNIHTEGYFSPTSFPNLNVAASETYRAAFGATGFPCGVVNRSTAQAQGRGSWQSLANQQFSQTAECNVAGQVVINPVTRLAKITVEVYYTANSAESTNYLTVFMLQDSIWGSQSGGSSNPEQYVGGQYCHMHIFRDVVSSAWGEPITTTTAGSLFTKEFVYEIPESIGNPNGVVVDLDNISFIAFVTEKYQGVPTRPILNVNELTMTQGTEEAIYPIIANVAAASGFSCSTTRTLKLDLVNGGLDELTSLKYQVKVADNEPIEFTWEGSIASYQSSSIEIDVDMPFGTQTVEVSIVEANGTAYEFTKTGSVTTEEWATVEVEGETEELTIDIMQDKYGNQITWELLASDMTVIASGGPYTMLVGGSNATQLHIEKATVSKGDCVKFVIKDAVGNGICCSFGEGYYQIKDSKGNIVVDGDGDFGSEASALLSIGAGEAVEEIETVESFNIFPNPVKDVLTVKGENMKQVVISNALGQVVETINTNDNEVRVDVSAFNNGMYFINVIDNNGEMTTSKVSVLH